MDTTPSPAVLAEISALLPTSSGQVGAVARCVQQGIVNRREIINAGAAANNGAVGNILSYIAAIRDGTVPRSPVNAKSARGATRRFLREHGPVLSPEAVAHLEQVLRRLDAHAKPSLREQRLRATRSRPSSDAESGGLVQETYEGSDLVTALEIADRLGRKPPTIAKWIELRQLPEPDGPISSWPHQWQWHTVLRWAGQTGRLFTPELQDLYRATFHNEPAPANKGGTGVTLTERQQAEIAASSRPARELALEHGVSDAYIFKIRRQRNGTGRASGS